ncbi:hypothetical protein P7C70_g1833, partial [Phenoliferia sp. Uapishka_3]
MAKTSRSNSETGSSASPTSTTETRPAYSLRKRTRVSTGGGSGSGGGKRDLNEDSDASSLTDLSESDGDADAKDEGSEDEYEDRKTAVAKRKVGRPRKSAPPPVATITQAGNNHRPTSNPFQRPQLQTGPTPTNGPPPHIQTAQHSPALFPPASQTAAQIHNLRHQLQSHPAHLSHSFAAQAPPPGPPGPFRQHHASPPAYPPPDISNDTPFLSHLFARIRDVIENARVEATRDDSLQTRSQSEVEASILRLPTRKHRSALCLTMNRYSAFCASPHIDVPAFPITIFKVAVFLSRSSRSPTCQNFLHHFPQPPTYPLPLAFGLGPSPPMGKSEGEVVTRELVRSWIEALGYAQDATRGVWDSILPEVGGKPTSFLEAPHLKELMGSFETLADVKSRGLMGGEARHVNEVDDGRSAEADEPAKKKTKWVKGGRSVEAPRKLTGSPDLAMSPGVMNMPSPSLAGLSTPSLSEGSSSSAPSDQYYSATPLSHGFAFRPPGPSHPMYPQQQQNIRPMPPQVIRSYPMGGYQPAPPQHPYAAPPPGVAGYGVPPHPKYLPGPGYQFGSPFAGQPKYVASGPPQQQQFHYGQPPQHFQPRQYPTGVPPRPSQPLPPADFDQDGQASVEGAQTNAAQVNGNADVTNVDGSSRAPQGYEGEEVHSGSEEAGEKQETNDRESGEQLESATDDDTRAMPPPQVPQRINNSSTPHSPALSSTSRPSSSHSHTHGEPSNAPPPHPLEHHQSPSASPSASPGAPQWYPQQHRQSLPPMHTSGPPPPPSHSYAYQPQQTYSMGYNPAHPSFASSPAGQSSSPYYNGPPPLASTSQHQTSYRQSYPYRPEPLAYAEASPSASMYPTQSYSNQTQSYQPSFQKGTIGAGAGFGAGQIPGFSNQATGMYSAGWNAPASNPGYGYPSTPSGPINPAAEGGGR